ncbi:glyoxalase [Nocardioides sp. YIM 152315]|uniref:glyoxalase n=1 Tax=Nocardioides sp. YIM 152315 TaxID=3031760 RepID=UPI0023DB0D34|nr:glyoxalase [Nocardioides sp. YIM 152315]MDF1602494.1 glyoxalase [Nocardioides sp. YIM 152315]
MSTTTTVTVDSLVIETSDPAATDAFHAALGLGDVVGSRQSDSPTDGFRGYSISLIAAQPSTVDAIVRAALDAGATEVKSVRKSFWGYGGVVQAPDGTLWKVVSQSKKDTGPATREFEEVVILLGVDDVKASRHFYEQQGLSVGKSFGGKYAELETGPRVKVALYPRKAAAKDAGVPTEGSGSHRLVVRASTDGFTDPDGYVWESGSD